MNLKYDPYAVFMSGCSPVSVYARKKWLGQPHPDYQRALQDALVGQRQDGSWQGSSLETIRRLFALHLIVREACPAVRMGLEWLLVENLSVRNEPLGLPVKGLSVKNFRGLPFAPGRYVHLAATLFLAAIFGYDQDERVIGAYAALERQGSDSDGFWCGRVCTGNLFRAFVVHPQYKRGKATGLVVREYARLQDHRGVWPEGIAFFPTFNALAHLDDAAARQQCDRACVYLQATQNGDGTWGRVDRVWNTFLVVHALRNLGLL